MDEIRTEAGVWCRGCGALEIGCYDTIHAACGIVRGRKCKVCGWPLLTIETAMLLNPAVLHVRAKYPPIIVRGRPVDHKP